MVALCHVCGEQKALIYTRPKARGRGSRGLSRREQLPKMDGCHGAPKAGSRVVAGQSAGPFSLLLSHLLLNGS